MGNLFKTVIVKKALDHIVDNYVNGIYTYLKRYL
jgi:hypothetical protein